MKSILNLFFLVFFLCCATICCTQNSLLLTDNASVKQLNIFPEKEQPTKDFTSPYELSLKKEISFFSVGLGVQLAGLSLHKKVAPLTVEDLEFLNPASVRAFDRSTIGNYSLRAQKTSDIFLYSSVAFPLLFLADKNMRKDYLKIGSMAAEALLLNGGITTLIKSSVKRTRPYVYDPLIPIEKKLSTSARMSFFSGHTSTVATMSFFSAKVFADYHPDSKWKPVVWTVATVLPATTAYLRYKGGKHFPTDVIVGYGVGAAIGILVPHLHRSKDKQFKLTPMVTGDAFGLSLNGVF